MSTALDVIKTVLPWVGSALGGPLAPIIAGFAASKLGVPADQVETTITSMLGNPEALEKLKALEYETQIKLQEMGYQSIKDLTELEVRAAEAVNKTMQSESTAEHWPQYSWRPFNGFLFGITMFGNYFILPLFDKSSVDIPETVLFAWGGILGIASFFRGKAQADPNIPLATRIAPQPGLLSKISNKIVEQPAPEPVIVSVPVPNAQNVVPVPTGPGSPGYVGNP